MRRIIIGIVALWPVSGLAQSQEEDDQGYLTNLIEENLTGAGREVDIRGFEGALSSQATMDSLTVADSEGVWLTLEDVVLSWNRSALLRGAIDVEELSAARIIVARAPVSEDSGPSPEAQPFSLPELPVSISLGVLNIEDISLGAEFLGEELNFSLSGAAELSGGEGSANIVAERLGEQQGRFEIDGSYVNETKTLGILLDVAEGPDGIAANLIGLPGNPAIGMTIEGNAPLDDFAATLSIATDRQDRLSGNFALTETDGERVIALDVGGDISPLFEPEYQGFFGNDAQLAARVVQTTDGRIDIPTIELDAGRVALSGAIQIGAQGWPELIDLTGGITALGNAPVLLPLTGPQTYVDGMDLAISYDASVSEDWQADITIDQFDRPGLGIDQLSLQGGGLLRPGEGADIGEVTVNLRYAAEGLQLDDAGAAEAFGDTIEGVFEAARTEGEATRISRLTLTGAGIESSAEATIVGASSGFQTSAALNMQVTGLERFSTLIGQEISGAAELGVLAQTTPLDGLFNIVVTGQTNDLSVGVTQADAVLAGTGTISAAAIRDTEGTRLETLRIETDAATITADGELTSNGSDGTLDARLNDLDIVLSGLRGPATIAGEVTQSGDGVISFQLDGTGPATRFETSGTATPAETGQTIAAQVSADISDLSRYAMLADRPLSGATRLEIGGTLETDGLLFDLDVTGATQDIVTGIDRADPFLAGTGRLAAGVARSDAQQFQISGLGLQTPAISIAGGADLDFSAGQQADLDIRINDAGLLDPSLSGPITLSLEGAPGSDDATETALRINGPDTAVSFDGTIGGPSSGYLISGDLTAEAADLGTYASLIGQPLDGGVSLTASGEAQPDLSLFDAQISLQSQDLAIGNSTVDPLLAGTGRINASIGQTEDGLAVRTLEISTPEISIVGALNGAAGHGQGRFNASLRDVGVLTDQISGPIRATGSASLDENGNWGLDATGTGPGGLGAQVAGQVGADGTLNIDIDGSAPLALANNAIDPRRLSGQANFDLGINGPAALTSLGGQITFSNGRLAAPSLGEALTDITGQIGLNGGTAQIDLDTRVESGGSISIDGPVSLTGTNDADITVDINDVVLQDPELYTSSIDGTVTIIGALQGGARVRGRLTLGETDVRVPSSSISTLGDLPDVTHIGAGTPVRQTLSRAGVLGQSSSGSGGAGGSQDYPLDIRISAPSRIFIRGRGLDAELGGELTIGGTSSNVIPVGEFALVRGRLDILQQRFDLDEGIVTLQGDFEPYLRLVATTETENGTTISIIIEGPASEPEVTFESSPQLPQDEVLSQLIFGRDLDSISPLQAVQLASAISTLAGRGGGALDRLRESVGLDDFDVTTDDEGETELRAGKYLSDNVYTDVTVGSDGGTEINLNLDITDEITAKGSVDQDGETGIGLFFERDY
ncbi:translocation/assembly module TamB domain-containing protein [Yoonia sp. BS5-3]|uniref:Translocation/assembly module TamB domain-containing protein n=1 Tax=Yoonia phaeophyticola TaxID=3137369 RepID=A0ABZ2VAA8_9RHOB